MLCIEKILKSTFKLKGLSAFGSSKKKQKINVT